MTNAALARRARRQANREFRRGNIDEATLNMVLDACDSEKVLTEWNKQIYEARLNPWEHPGVLMGFDWAVIWDWFVANWPKILEILFLILPLFLGENDEDSRS